MFPSPPNEYLVYWSRKGVRGHQTKGEISKGEHLPKEEKKRKKKTSTMMRVQAHQNCQFQSLLIKFSTSKMAEMMSVRFNLFKTLLRVRKYKARKRREKKKRQ